VLEYAQVYTSLRIPTTAKFTSHSVISSVCQHKHLKAVLYVKLLVFCRNIRIPPFASSFYSAP